MWGQTRLILESKGIPCNQPNPMKAVVLGALCAALALSTLGCTKEGICDAGELQEALNNALRGDTVKVGVCHVSGSFTVPDGVTLSGQGRELTILSHTGEGPVVELTPGSREPVLRDLAIENHTIAGVLARGTGHARILRVDVRAHKGIGIGGEGLDSMIMEDVSLIGSVTAETAEAIPLEPSPSKLATHGIALVNVELADLTNVQINGFARMGSLFLDGRTEWRYGGSSENVGVGLLVHDGSALLEDLELCGGFRSLALHPPHAAMFLEGAAIETHRLDVCECEGVGLFHDSSGGTHTDLTARDNDDAAVWVQNTEAQALEILGVGTRFVNNGLAGIVLKDAGDVRVEGADFEAMTKVTVVRENDGDLERFDVADGIQIVNPLGDTRLRDVRLAFNKRVGLLLDVERPVALTLERVEVEGEGEQLGALIQGEETSIPADWDIGVSRLGATLANDQDFIGRLGVIESVGPAELPDVTDIINEGLDAILSD